MFYSFFMLKFLTSLILLFFIDGSLSHFCNESVCKLCCKPTQSGCVNGFVQHYSLTLSSVSLACQDCNCSNPEIGCGWVGRRFKRVECNSCSTLLELSDMNPDIPIAGCGNSIINGALIYTS